MENKKIPLLYVIGMPLIFIIASFIGRIYFTILGSPLYLSVLIYPLTFLISGLVIKKANYKESITVMAISLISVTLFFVLKWVLFDTIDSWLMIYSFLSFLICQLIFIYTYDFLIKINKDNYIAVFLVTLIVLAIDNAFFGVIIEGTCISLSILVRIIYLVAIPVALASNSTDKKEQ